MNLLEDGPIMQARATLHPMYACSAFGLALYWTSCSTFHRVRESRIDSVVMGRAAWADMSRSGSVEGSRSEVRAPTPGFSWWQTMTISPPPGSMR